MVRSPDDALSDPPSALSDLSPNAPITGSEADEDCLLAHAFLERSGKATAALLLGLLSFGLSILAAIPAILLGFISLREIDRAAGRLTGKQVAVAGIVLGCLGTMLPIVALHLVYPWHSQVTAMNNLKEISDATIRAAEENDGRMVAQAICGNDGQPLLSWRVALLPYLGHDDLYQRFRLDEPWDGPNNTHLVLEMPKVFAHPLDRAGASRGLTHWRVFTGPDTPFPVPIPPFPPGLSSLRYPASFSSGTHQTLLIVEAADPVPWTKPEELPYRSDQPLPKLGGRFRGGFLIALADGSARLVSADVSEKAVRDAIDPAHDYGWGQW